MRTKAMTVRFTDEQHDWLRRRAFDANQSKQTIIEDALAALGMPVGAVVRIGTVVTGAPVPIEARELTDVEGMTWVRSRSRAYGWDRQGGDEPYAVSGREMVARYGPLTVTRLRRL